MYDWWVEKMFFRIDKSAGKKLFCVHVCVHTKELGACSSNSIYAIWCLMCTIICAESLPIHQDELLFACLCRVEGRVSTENQCVTFVCRWIYFQISADCYMRWSVLRFYEIQLIIKFVGMRWYPHYSWLLVTIINFHRKPQFSWARRDDDRLWQSCVITLRKTA